MDAHGSTPVSSGSRTDWSDRRLQSSTGLGASERRIVRTTAASVAMDRPVGYRPDAAAAVGEIRRLVYDMRPPALDELGLVAALRQQVSITHTPTGTQVHVLVSRSRPTATDRSSERSCPSAENASADGTAAPLR